MLSTFSVPATVKIVLNSHLLSIFFPGTRTHSLRAGAARCQGAGLWLCAGSGAGPGTTARGGSLVQQPRS